MHQGLAEPPLAATIEYRGKADVSIALASADAHNLFVFMQRVGIVAGQPDSLPKPLCVLTPLDGVDHIRAPQAGVVIHLKQVGDTVKVGETVAYLLDPLGQIW